MNADVTLTDPVLTVTRTDPALTVTRTDPALTRKIPCMPYNWAGFVHLWRLPRVMTRRYDGCPLGRVLGTFMQTLKFQQLYKHQLLSDNCFLDVFVDASNFEKVLQKNSIGLKSEQLIYHSCPRERFAILIYAYGVLVLEFAT